MLNDRQNENPHDIHEVPVKHSIAARAGDFFFSKSPASAIASTISSAIEAHAHVDAVEPGEREERGRRKEIASAHRDAALEQAPVFEPLARRGKRRRAAWSPPASMLHHAANAVPRCCADLRVRHRVKLLAKRHRLKRPVLSKSKSFAVPGPGCGLRIVKEKREDQHAKEDGLPRAMNARMLALFFSGGRHRRCSTFPSTADHAGSGRSGIRAGPRAGRRLWIGGSSSGKFSCGVCERSRRPFQRPRIPWVALSRRLRRSGKAEVEDIRRGEEPAPPPPSRRRRSLKPGSSSPSLANSDRCKRGAAFQRAPGNAE